MTNLLRVNLYRMRKDILLYVCLAVSIVMVFASAATFQMLGLLTGVDAEALGMFASGKTMLLNALSPMNNMGMLIPILLILMLARDYSNGTIRNKIICGYSRTTVFMASWVSALIFGAAMLLINMLGNLGIGCLLFGYGEPFDDKAVRELLTIIAEDEELSDITTNVKSKNTKIISVFSSFGGAGVSSFAWNKCKESSAFQKTLYVNLELFDGFGEFCEGTDNKRAYIRGMSEIVFYLKQEGSKLSVKLESLVRQRDGIYYILPVEDYKDLYSISVKEMKKFIEIIADETIYENIVFDVGYISDAVISLLEISDDIYMPKPLTGVQQNKLNSFYRILERTEKDKLRDIIKYYDENLCEVMI